jgi:hypothetical protein
MEYLRKLDLILPKWIESNSLHNFNLSLGRLPSLDHAAFRERAHGAIPRDKGMFSII